MTTYCTLRRTAANTGRRTEPMPALTPAMLADLTPPPVLTVPGLRLEWTALDLLLVPVALVVIAAAPWTAHADYQPRHRGYRPAHRGGAR